MRRLLGGSLAAAIAVAGLLTWTVTVHAHTGTVTAVEDCRDGWAASVILNHNVTIDRRAEVITTIPGTTGVSGHFPDGVIWSWGGKTQETGTVTLNIWDGKHLEFTTSASITALTDCTPKPTPTPTPLPTPSSTPTPTPLPVPSTGAYG